MNNYREYVTQQDVDDRQQQIERIEVLEALAESAGQIKAGKVHDARKAVGKLISEMKAR